MSHFAKVESGIVVQVIVAEQDHIDTLSGQWVQTSYNTRGGKHYAPNSNVEDGGVALRKNYACIGDTYDETKDAFIDPQPYPSWTLNESTCRWECPKPYPDERYLYAWNEETGEWDFVSEYDPDFEG